MQTKLQTCCSLSGCTHQSFFFLIFWCEFLSCKMLSSYGLLAPTKLVHFETIQYLDRGWTERPQGTRSVCGWIYWRRVLLASWSVWPLRWLDQSLIYNCWTCKGYSMRDLLKHWSRDFFSTFTFNSWLHDDEIPQTNRRSICSCCCWRQRATNHQSDCNKNAGVIN